MQMEQLVFTWFDLLMAVTVVGYVAFVVGIGAGTYYERTRAAHGD
jgi:hypothetical protein